MKALKPLTLFMIVATTFTAVILWLYLITQVSPDRSNYLIVTGFFLSMFVWVASFIFLGLLSYRLKTSNHEVIYAHLRPSLRQGIIVSFVIITLLFLQFLHVDTIIDTLIIVGVGILFELGARYRQVGEGKL